MAMELQALDSELRRRLIEELGDHGRRAVEFLETAHSLLGYAPQSALRVGQAVAYCIREAMTEIPEAAGTGDPGAWKDVSRRVVKARERYRLVEGLPGPDAEQGLRELLAQIDDLASCHYQQGVHQRRLDKVMSDIMGDAPLSVGAAPARAYQDLLGRVNDAVHGHSRPVSGEQLWSECLAALHRLFLAPEVRFAQLERLAQIESPTEQDRGAVIELLVSPEHLRRFLNSVASPAWLILLAETGHLDPPADARTNWPAHQAVRRLAAIHPDEVVYWLEEMTRQHGSDPISADHLARAAFGVGKPATALVLSIVQDHQQHPDILLCGVHAAGQLPSSDDLVEAFADVILNEGSWARATWPNPLLKQLADGVSQANSRRRIELVCHKIRSIPEDDLDLWSLRWDPSRSIADAGDNDSQDRVPALLSCLTDMVARSWGWIPAENLLEAALLLPDDLSQRLRAWILARAPNVSDALLGDEITAAIASRFPTGDDLALVDRAVSGCRPSGYTHQWRAALGNAPSINQLGHALGAEDISRGWIQASEWASLLPAAAAGQWTTVNNVLDPLFGPTRPRLEQQPDSGVSEVLSPYSDEELLSLAPEQAANRIAAWRPEPGDWPNRVRLLAQTVESVVKQEPDGWISAPLRIVTTLRHPIHISRYLQAVAALARQRDLPVDKLLDAVALIRRRPWPAEQITSDTRGGDNDWSRAEAAAIRLIQALSSSGCTFDGRSDEVWAILEAEAANCPQQPEAIIDSDDDPYTSAINRPCTQALEAALLLLSNEFGTSGSVRAEAIRILDASLCLTGRDGVEHRAVLAPRIGFLRHVIPEWTDTNRGLLFGEDAPQGLAQGMVDQAIKWGQPNEWLLENYRTMVRDAVKRKIDRALVHLLVATLWELPGYSTKENLAFLMRSPELLSNAGETLGRLLGRADAEQRHVEIAATFWEAALGAAAGDALSGFGWFSKIESMDADSWAEMTLRTLKATGGRIGRSHGVAERVAASPPSQTGLAILDELVRGTDSDWERRNVAEQAAQMLSDGQALDATVEHRRLRQTLLERGLLDD